MDYRRPNCAMCGRLLAGKVFSEDDARLVDVSGPLMRRFSVASLRAVDGL